VWGRVSLPHTFRACAVAGGASIVGATHAIPTRRGDASPKPTNDRYGQSNPKPGHANRCGTRDASPAHGHPTGEAFLEPGYSRKLARCTKRGGSNQVASGMPRPYDVELHLGPVARARRPPASPIVGATHRRNRQTIVTVSRTRNPGTQTGAARAMRRPHTVNRRARHSENQATSRKLAQCTKRGRSN
jgi:hypothetical protein